METTIDPEVMLWLCLGGVATMIFVVWCNVRKRG